MYHKILLPLDGSELSGHAIPHAVDIARSMEAEIVVLRVVDPSVSPLESIALAGDPALGAGAATTFSIEERRIAERAEAEQELDEALQAIQGHGFGEVTVRLAEGSAGETIVSLAEELGCDLVVMSSRGRSGVRRAVLGSVTDHVVRHTPRAAVLVVVPGEDGD